MKKTFGFVVISLCIGLFACTNSNNKKVQNQKDALEADMYENEKPIPQDIKGEDVIFYNIFTPTDMSNLINEYSTFYKSNLINSLNNITKYNQSTSMALNIGIYGADLNYLWVFEQSQQAASYVAAIQMLCSQLDIPSNYVTLTAERAEQYSYNVDSLKSIARSAYKDITKYLNQSGRGNSAALILLGGWIETLYIAVNMYSQPDAKMVSRIATQRFSLNIIINLLQNQQNDLDVAGYLVLLRKLRKAFDDFVVHVPREALIIDTINKRITIKDNDKMKFDTDQINEIRNETNKIRDMIVH